MIEAIKKLFTRDKSIEMKMLDIIEKQQEFIRTNINERVVYLDKDMAYSNVDRFDEKKSNDEDDEFEMPEDMTPEMLAEYIEGKNNQGEGEK